MKRKAMARDSLTADKWAAQIKILGRNHFLGRFNSSEEAHAAYVAASLDYFGDFARTK